MLIYSPKPPFLFGFSDSSEFEQIASLPGLEEGSVRVIYVLQYLMLFTDFVLNNVMKLLDIDPRRHCTALLIKKSLEGKPVFTTTKARI